MRAVKILVADDEPISRRLLETHLARWGYEVVGATDGAEACRVLERDDAPPLAIIDWMMPELDGLEVCRKIRAVPRNPATYIILLTVRDSGGDVVQGLDAGADDYVTKPFDREELRARVQVGVRVVALQTKLTERLADLEDALANLKRLQGLLPICSYCKKIRNDRNYWQQVETYISERSEAQFSHGICPDCYQKFVKPELGKSSPINRTRR